MSTLADNAPRMAGAGDWIDAALAPRSVAIVGASDNPEKIGGRPIKYMLQHGYQGRILPINPGRDRVQGIAAWHSLDAVNVPIDMLLVCVAGEAAVQAVRDGARLGVRVCVVISSGFAETGEPGRQAQKAAAQQQLRAHDQAARVGHAQDAMLAEPGVQRLVLGGDGAGVRLRGLQALRRNAGLQGQHGHLARTRQRGRARQGGGRGQAFHVEQDQPDFGVAQHRLGEVRDVEVAFVAGGDRVAHADAFGAQVRVRDHAHRAALADDGHRPVGGGNLAQQGGEGRQGAVAEIGQALGVRPQQAHAGRRGGRLHVLLPGNRLAILSNSGAACVTGADAAERHGLQVPPLPAETRARIDAVLPGFASSLNPIDLTAALLSNNHLFGQVLPILASARACDALFITLPMSGKGYDTDQFARDAAAFTAETGLPVVVSCPLAASRRIFAQAGLATFEHDEDALAALGQLARLSGLRETALRLARPAPHAPAAPVPRTAGLLSEADSLEQIEAIGIRTAPWRLCLDADSMGSALGSLPGPWAVKACSAQIPHKSEYGLVHLGIADEQRARALFPVLRQEVLGMGKSFDGVIVASMVKPRREFMIGARWDSQFGCIVIVGDGGKYVEAMPDVATLVYPFDQAHAEECLRKLRVAALFDGVRGENPLPVQELAHAATRLGAWLHAQQGAVASVDINPLIAGPDGRLYAADALVEI